MQSCSGLDIRVVYSANGKLWRMVEVSLVPLEATPGFCRHLVAVVSPGPSFQRAYANVHHGQGSRLFEHPTQSLVVTTESTCQRLGIAYTKEWLTMILLPFVSCSICNITELAHMYCRQFICRRWIPNVLPPTSSLRRGSPELL